MTLRRRAPAAAGTGAVPPPPARRRPATAISAQGLSRQADGWHGVPLEVERTMPDVTLLDTAGNAVDLREATAGTPTLLFFGYTSCPDICPIHLAVSPARCARSGSPPSRSRSCSSRSTPSATPPSGSTSSSPHFDRRFLGLHGDLDVVADALGQLDLPGPVVEGPDPRGEGDLIGHPAQVIGFDADGRAQRVWPFGARRSDWILDLPRIVDEWSAPRERRLVVLVDRPGLDLALHPVHRGVGRRRRVDRRLRARPPPGRPPARACRLRPWCLGVLALFVVSEWPIGQLGAGYLATLGIARYVVYSFVAAPLLLTGIPTWLVDRWLPFGTRREQVVSTSPAGRTRCWCSTRCCSAPTSRSWSTRSSRASWVVHDRRAAPDGRADLVVAGAAPRDRAQRDPGTDPRVLPVRVQRADVRAGRVPDLQPAAAVRAVRTRAAAVARVRRDPGPAGRRDRDERRRRVRAVGHHRDAVHALGQGAGTRRRPRPA